MKEAVNEEHEGKRKCELTWKVHRIHWEKNRFVYDLMYKRKVMSRELVSASTVSAHLLLISTTCALQIHVKCNHNYVLMHINQLFSFEQSIAAVMLDNLSQARLCALEDLARRIVWLSRDLRPPK